MCLQLKYDEDFSKGIKRLISAQVEEALSDLEKPWGDKQRHEAVHAVRKAFKKIRALLRLIRDEVDYYKQENVFFRDLARPISEIRDATAHLETLELLKQQYQSQLYKNSFHRLEEKLKQSRQELADKVFKKEKRLQKIKEGLEEHKATIPFWPVKISKFKQVEPSLERVYTRGKDAMQTAAKSHSVKDLHQWRKRAKYLRYQLDIINRVWPGMMTTYEDELHALSDYLGMNHDLHNLSEAAKNLDAPFSSDNEEILFNALVKRHQELMEKHALRLGEKFYCEDAGAFTKRLGEYWASHQKQLKAGLPAPAKLEY